MPKYDVELDIGVMWVMNRNGTTARIYCSIPKQLKQCWHAFMWCALTVFLRYNVASTDSLVDNEWNRCWEWWTEHRAEIPIHWVWVPRLTWNWKTEKSSINKISPAVQLLTSRYWSWMWKGKGSCESKKMYLLW